MARTSGRVSSAKQSPPPSAKPLAALALGAHPDDIEFYMAGTLILLREAGWEIHYMTLASGSCGSLQHRPSVLRRIRRKESQAAAALLGARYHPSLCDDLEIFYDLKTLRRLAAVMRAIQPSVVLTHGPSDYMEDHTNTCRLAVTAAFARGMPNFRTTPNRQPTPQEVAIYHAVPHGLQDGLRRRVLPELFVDTGSVQALKTRALAAHASQKEWLDASQGMDSYLRTMEEFSRAVGRWSGRFKHAEGWRRHSHVGFSEREIDPLRTVLRERCHFKLRR